MSKTATREDVKNIYKTLLLREPENETAYTNNIGRLYSDIVKDIVESLEFSIKIEIKNKISLNQSRTTACLWDYVSTFDAIGPINRFEVANRKPIKNHIVNFMGVAMDVQVIPALKLIGGTLEARPSPGNFHACVAEWGSALRSVELARDSFTMIELGCGWGCWMNNTGVAAKRLGLKTHVIGIEGDTGHIEFARQALKTNGITTSEYTLHRGVATAEPGIALFPMQGAPGQTWGLEPIFGASTEQRTKLVGEGLYENVRHVPLAEAIGNHERIDLLHSDIQGGEADLIHDTLPLLNEKVAYLFIGTHSRIVEGRLMADLTAAGWILELERPAIYEIHGGKPILTIDGCQAWRNPRLLPN